MTTPSAKTESVGLIINVNTNAAKANAAAYDKSGQSKTGQKLFQIERDFGGEDRMLGKPRDYGRD